METPRGRVSRYRGPFSRNYPKERRHASQILAFLLPPREIARKSNELKHGPDLAKLLNHGQSDCKIYQTGFNNL